MKAILSLVILLGSVNVIATSDSRVDAQWRYEVEKNQREFCAKNTEYCAAKEDIKTLTLKRSQVVSKYRSAQYGANRACENTSIRTSERMSVDGVVKYVSFTPCEKIAEYNENAKPYLAKTASLAVEIKAIDALLAEKNAELKAATAKIKK